MILSARIKHTWQEIMDQRGWSDFCDSTTEFNHISYNYTKDAPVECTGYGEWLWDVLMKNFVGGVHYADEGAPSLSRQPLNVVTRRHELWDK